MRTAADEYNSWSDDLGVSLFDAIMGLLQFREGSARLHAAGALLALSTPLLQHAAAVDSDGQLCDPHETSAIAHDVLNVYVAKFCILF
jgi:hypothetical protein